MQKPEVRIIEPQQEETRVVDASQSERDYLLAKYGYKSNNFQEVQNTNSVDPLQRMTFDEFAELNERNQRERENMERQKRNIPRAYTFDNVNYYESKYSDLDLDGHSFGIKVQVVSDMPINNQRR